MSLTRWLHPALPARWTLVVTNAVLGAPTAVAHHSGPVKEAGAEIRRPHRLGRRRAGLVAGGLALAAILLLVAHPASAAGLQERLDQGDVLLREGRFAEALAISGPLLREVGPKMLAPGTAGEEALGMVLALHALAQAGVAQGGGEPDPALERQAVAYWTLAQSLHPVLRKSSLAAYGAAGEWLAGYRVDEECKPVGPFADGREPVSLEEAGVIPPRKIRAPQPDYLPAAREAGLQGAVILATVIDADGRVTYPCVLDTDSPAFAYETAEAALDWRFEPALYDGVPWPIHYKLTTSFRLDR